MGCLLVNVHSELTAENIYQAKLFLEKVKKVWLRKPNVTVLAHAKLPQKTI